MIQKNNTIKMIFLFLIVLLLFSSYPIYGNDLNQEENMDIANEIKTLTEEVSSDVSNQTLNLNSRSCVVIDRLAQSILYGKNEKNKVKMASTTKIMTAIVVLENSS